MAYKPKVLAIADGGSNASSFSTTSGIVSFNGTSLVSSSTGTIDSTGRITLTSQPSSNDWLFTGVTNVTGDGTVYTPIFDQVQFDQNSNFNTGTGVFTAPITGIYLMTLTATFNNLAAGHTSGSLIFDTTGGPPFQTTFNPVVSAVSASVTFSLTSTLKLTATQTVTPKVQISGSTKTVGLAGASGGRAFTFFLCTKVA